MHYILLLNTSNASDFFFLCCISWIYESLSVCLPVARRTAPWRQASTHRKIISSGTLRRNMNSRFMPKYHPLRSKYHDTPQQKNAAFYEETFSNADKTINYNAIYISRFLKHFYCCTLQTNKDCHVNLTTLTTVIIIWLFYLFKQPEDDHVTYWNL